MTVNRRSATRHDVAIAVSVVLQGSTEPVEATLENLSLGGAFVTLSRRLSIGARLSLRFRLPTRDQAIETGAVVRWCSDQGAGVQFDGLRAGEVWSLGKFIEGLARP